MVRISVEVTSGAARFRVMIQAHSIQRALEVVSRQNPGRDVGVVFPIDPETYFVRDCGAVSGAQCLPPQLGHPAANHV
jgi:hypothetical protein